MNDQKTFFRDAKRKKTSFKPVLRGLAGSNTFLDNFLAKSTRMDDSVKLVNQDIEHIRRKSKWAIP